MAAGRLASGPSGQSRQQRAERIGDSTPALGDRRGARTPLRPFPRHPTLEGDPVRLISRLPRMKVPIIATASVTAALGLIAIVPAAASTTTTINSTHPYFTPWKLGTPLPV